MIASGTVPVFSACWFNTGYMSTSVYGGFWTFHTLVFQRNAWFDSGFLLMRQITVVAEPFTVHTAENCGFSAVAVRSGRRHLFRFAEAVPHGPGYSADHRDSPDVRIWWSMSLSVRSCRFSVLSVLRQSRSHSSARRHHRRGTEADPMVQTVRLTIDFAQLLYAVIDVPGVVSTGARPP